MDFVDKQDRALAVCAVMIRLLHDGANFLDSRRYSGEIDEFGLCNVRNNVCERRFPYAWRPPENHRGNRVVFDHPPKNFPVPQQPPLSYDLVERSRTQPRRERLLRRGSAKKRRLLCHHKTPTPIRDAARVVGGAARRRLTLFYPLYEKRKENVARGTFDAKTRAPKRAVNLRRP